MESILEKIFNQRYTVPWATSKLENAAANPVEKQKDRSKIEPKSEPIFPKEPGSVIIKLDSKKDKKKLRIWLTMGLITVALIIILWGGGKGGGGGGIFTKATNTPTPTAPPTERPQPTATPIPTLGVGSIQKNEKDGMEMVYVPAGSFLMGSESGDVSGNESPEHEVYLDAYWMDKYEVSNEMYRKCVEAGACDEPNKPENYNNESFVNSPVVYVGWNDAYAYCEWVGRRLPTEAEWEHAASGPDNREYPWGDSSPTSRQANFNWNLGNTARITGYPEGASYYGAYNMAGNVWEWVSDWYEWDYYSVSPEKNPQGPTSGNYRVRRGGSWESYDNTLRSSYRTWDFPGRKVSGGGFRCAASP